MANLVEAADVRVLVETSLTDDELDDLIERIEADITAEIGSPQNDGGTVTHEVTVAGEGENLFMPTEITSISSIVEDTVTLDSDQYQTWAGGVIERLPSPTTWGDRVVVTYYPADDRKKRTQAVIDLCRIYLNQTAMKSESVGGEYSYQAPENWDVEVRKVMRRLRFVAV